MDDCFNLTATPSQDISSQQHHLATDITTNDFPNSITSSSLSLAANINDNAQQEQPTAYKLQSDHQTHTISSGDEEEFVTEQNTIEEQITNMSSNESGDFEGFDDYTTPNSSGLINDASQEDLNMPSNYLKRLSQLDSNEYYEYSEGYVEAIEVEDDDEDEEIAICDDGKIIYKPKEEITPKKSQMYRSDPHTPNKRTKHEIDTQLNANLLTQLKTPPDQVVEVNSDSTTNSLKEKRQQINTKFQLNLNQQQNHKHHNNPNKCSTESTSEFPVSSPSNPQQPRGGKYPPRPPLLKNTLPADSFERQLAMITACNPQMTLAEKIQTWDCDEDLSDVEDVNKFDEKFRRQEKQKMEQREKSGRIKNTENKIYDYFTFRQMILIYMKEQKNQKYNSSGPGGVGGMGVCVDTSGSESSKSVAHVDERPSTSAVAQQQLQQRRSKPQLCLETGEPKKRMVKEIPKRNQNSTTPPQTSSSDNDRDCFRNSKSNTGQRLIQTHQKLLCPSQDVPSHVFLKTNSKCAQVAFKSARKKSPAQPQLLAPQSKSNETPTQTKNSRVLTDAENDSVFRLHRLNRERDKYNRSPVINETDEQQSPSIIKVRLDLTNENKNEILMEKKQELFKTPPQPQKYLANSLMTTEYQRRTSLSPTKNLATNEEIKKESHTTTFSSQSPLAGKVKNESSSEKFEIISPNDDQEGVYHQQHEFCSYLGLTGMSTATAMANAVAELAQCNLARRSMRVLRQQQQERRDKSAKEERQLQALKLKQLKEVRKREKVSCDSMPVLETEQSTVIKSYESSHSQASKPEKSLKDPIYKTSNNSNTKSSTQSQNSITIIKKEPEIKIICQITSKNKEDNNLPTECIKKNTQPVREKLMRQVKQSKSVKATDNGKHIYEEENLEQHFKVSDIHSGQIHKEEKPNSVLEMPSIEKENIKRIEKLSTGKCPTKNTGIRSQTLNKTKESIQNQETSLVCKLESVVDTNSVTKSLDNTCASPFLKVEDFIKDDMQNINTEELTPSIIQQKLQMALEESRKSKPSIFIVQSLECKKEKVDKLNTNSFTVMKNLHFAETSPYAKNKKLEIKNDTITKSLKASRTKYKSNVKKRVFKTRKGKKYPTSKRQLRKRKIIVIKNLLPKQKSYSRLNEIKRELRSSPRIHEKHIQETVVKKTEVEKQKSNTPDSNEIKSYRTVHTETKDLENYLNKNNNQTKKRLMAKASALLERSRRMTLRGSCNLVNKKTKHAIDIKKSELNFHGTRTQILKPKVAATSRKRRSFKISSKNLLQTPMKTVEQINNASLPPNLLESENVVVSSTTNTYDERLTHEPLTTQSPFTLRSLRNAASYVIATSPIETKDQFTQCNVNTGVYYLNPLPTQYLRNPLKSEHGAVHYIYHELDILIVIQERLVSFWKYSKLISMLIPQTKVAACAHHTIQQCGIHINKQHFTDNCCNNQFKQPALSSTLSESHECGEWIQLGELRRLNIDFEISVPYANRICLHNSTPIYLEMRAQQLPKNQRDCSLLSMYINIYYYHDEDMIAKCNSISLDSIQSDINSVNYTTLIDSRYFIMTWPQENLLGKTRSGLCKYSLTPQLDTLASIREFKSLRHTIRYLECMSDDKLIGFGESQVTIWDYRSGDVLMNFDLEIPMGKNLGSVYFSSQDIEQSNMLILHQYRILQNNTPPKIMTIACTVTHTQPSYRVLQETSLPMPAFKVIKSAIKTGDHLVVIGQNNDELWISLSNPRLMTVIPNTPNSRRFYNRERTQLIELTDTTLNVNSLANHILQLAAGLVFN